MFFFKSCPKLWSVHCYLFPLILVLASVPLLSNLAICHLCSWSTICFLKNSSLMTKVKFKWQKQWRGLCCFCFLQVFEWVIEWLNWSVWNERAFLHNPVNWGEAKMSCHQISPTHKQRFRQNVIWHANQCQNKIPRE